MTEDVAGSLIDALADEGNHVDDGQFTLDSAAAYRKLRDYQLGDPDGYLLLLVEAAWLAGKDHPDAGIVIHLGAPTTVEFHGLALDPHSLPDLFGSVFGGFDELTGDALRRAQILQLLGLAAIHALKQEPTGITLTASDEFGTNHRIRIAPTGKLEVEQAEPSDPAKPRTVSFQVCTDRHDRARVKAQVAVLEERCRYTSLRVRVDGQLVSHGPRSDLIPDVTTIEVGGESIGIAGHTKDPKAAAATWFVNRGVGIREPVGGRHRGWQAIVECDLPMDLSRTQLLEGPPLDTIRAAIKTAVADLPPRETAPQPTETETSSAGSGRFLFGLLLAAITTLLLLSPVQC